MGGAVSSGRDNNELIDNLMGGSYIRSRSVERAFRALDRADYMTPEARDQAYKDLAWRSGLLHMSAPCIYSEVMEGLELKPGLSFLNVGSGTGYLSTLVGLILGSGGINHGVEVHNAVVEYANTKLQQFLESSPTLDEFEFCEPKFYCGNGLCLAPLQAPYDRVYCGAGCPEEYQNYFKQLIKVGGVLVMPLNDNLVQVRRVAAAEWRSRTLLNVSFAALRVPARHDQPDLIRLEEQTPARLQALSRAAPARRNAPRRICIPVDDDSDVESLNALHDLDPASGASEMNALLSLVLSMGHNRVAGALRFDQLDSRDHTPERSSRDPSPDSSHSSRSSRLTHSPSDSSDDDDGDGGGGGPPPDAGGVPVSEPNRAPQAAEGERDAPLARSVIMFEFRDSGSGDTRAGAAAARTPRPLRHPGDETTGAPRSPSPAGDAPAHSPISRSSSSTTHYEEAAMAEVENNPEVAKELEIFLGMSTDAPGTSTIVLDNSLEWKRERECSTDDESESASPRGSGRGAGGGPRARAPRAPRSPRADEKRQKLDSGLGEENTPSSGSSPADRDADMTDSEPEDPSTNKLCGDAVREGRRRWAAKCLAEAHAQNDARRIQFAVMMKRSVNELPLPYALKFYVNLNRGFEV